MNSVFCKLISKEFGENKYQQYLEVYKKKILDKSYDHKTLTNEEIFNDIYEELKDKDKTILGKKLERLTDTMGDALRINKVYIFAFVFYLMTSFFLISMQLVPIITIISLVLSSICFMYKTYEFIVNKFCYIDAHIAIVYKSVLDRLLLVKSIEK